MARTVTPFEKRRSRTRYRLKSTAYGRPRLTVFRSGKHIYAQVIDDEKAGKTYNVEAATAVGKKIAERAIAAGVKEVVFDRGGYIYHGRVKALADAAREAGLEF